MTFCPKCGSILIPKDKVLSCNCGYKEKTKEKIIIKEKIQKKDDIYVIYEDDEFIANPVVPVVCNKCGNKGAYFWVVQMRRADEAATRFYKCKKCKAVWRSSK